jgi:hypothetical protein
MLRLSEMGCGREIATIVISLEVAYDRPDFMCR